MPSLATLIWWAGLAQWSVLVASALVPIRLNWRTELSGLKRLHRQLYWTYGGYVVMAIVAFGAICVTCADELAAGSRLARVLAGYMAAFWGVRLALQSVFDVRPHLTAWWLRAGYHTLTLLFASFTMLFAFVAGHDL